MSVAFEIETQFAETQRFLDQSCYYPDVLETLQRKVCSPATMTLQQDQRAPIKGL